MTQLFDTLTLYLNTIW